jgi:hypothetical protein
MLKVFFIMIKILKKKKLDFSEMLDMELDEIIRIIRTKKKKIFYSPKKKIFFFFPLQNH